jgi:hypothetical protein
MYKKFNLVLDVDNTLIKCIVHKKDFIDLFLKLDDYDKNNIIKSYPELINIIPNKSNNVNNRSYLIHFYYRDHLYIIMMRPYLIKFILISNLYFNLHIYSLGSEFYIQQIIQALVNKLEFNPFNMIKSNSDIYTIKYRKYLSKLNLPRSNVLIIDDRIDVWPYDKHHLYNIIPYNDPHDNTDNELDQILNVFNKYFLFFTNDDFNIFKFKKLMHTQIYNTKYYS